MTNSRQHTNSPSPKQMSYLRSLAASTGESFAWPTTSAQASREIDRLQGRKRTSADDRLRERRQVSRDMATARGDASRVRDAELGGYGSTAHWANDTEERPGAGR